MLGLELGFGLGLRFGLGLGLGLGFGFGIETSVLWQRAVLQIDCWYARTDMFVGYHHWESAAWSAGTGGGRWAAAASGSTRGASGAVFTSAPVGLGRLSAGCGCHKGARGGGAGGCVRPERTLLNAEFWGSASSGGRGGAGPGGGCPLK